MSIKPGDNFRRKHMHELLIVLAVSEDVIEYLYLNEYGTGSKFINSEPAGICADNLEKFWVKLELQD